VNNPFPPVEECSNVHNFVPSIKEAISPIERFLQIQVSPRIRHCHAFGCPVYVLDGKLQTGKRLPKWDDQLRIGLFLRWLPRHSRKVALVLNLATGHVSPQFHVEFNDLFETMRPSAGNRPPKSSWQQKAGFLDSEKDPKASIQTTVQANHPMATPTQHQADRHDIDLDEPLAGKDPNEIDKLFEQGEAPVLPGPEDDVMPSQIQEPLTMQQQHHSRV
jgi:hypothetical protein